MEENKALLPFELYLRRNVNQKTDNAEFFIDTVEKVLKEELQRENSFGCYIKNCHTHVGSKMHLSSFIEAELLFHNSYYNKNFAYLTVNQLMEELKLSDYKRILIIGYETFSELYICEVTELLRNIAYCSETRDFNISSDNIQYGIYEQTVSGQVFIRYSFCEYEQIIKDKFPAEETLFVFIVPINTTLTTHGKMMDFFFQKYGGYNDKIHCINFGLILIAPKNNSYYQIISPEKRQVQLTEEWQNSLKTLGNKPVNFFVWINSNWYDVDWCPECFPDIVDKYPRDFLDIRNINEKRDLIHESPIFEVNRASVIPMLQLKTNTIPRPFNKEEIIEAKKNLEKVNILSRFAYHRHLVRNNNHHQFYFDTRRFFNDQRKKIKDWLISISNDIREFEQNPIVLTYNFIVAPRHYSNAGFVQLVNDVIFEGAARIFYFEAFKEFRGNIIAKYNDFSRIVSNIKLSGKNAKIRFHYVDDTIYSAGNYNRTRSLIKSLINNDIDKNDNVDISIFSSVIVLVGRTSIDTNRNFVSDIKRFYQYVRLSISPMRSFDNACSLCNLKEQFKELRKISATNKMDKICYETIKKYECSHVDNCEMTPLIKNEEKRYNILIWHLLEERINNRVQLDKKDSEPIISEDAKQIFRILKRFKEKILSKTLFESMSDSDIEDVYAAFIKTITRPFFIYHIRRKQASFRFCLNELSQLIKQADNEMVTFEGYFDEQSKYEFSGALQKKLLTKSYQKKLLKQLYLFRRIAALVNGLSDMNAFYVIRAEVLSVLLHIAQFNDRLLAAIMKMDKIDPIPFLQSLIFTRDNHLKSIKKLTIASRDDTKSLFLEQLVVEGDEKNFYKKPIEHHINFSEFSDHLLLYLENNKVLIDGLDELISTAGEQASTNRQNVEQLYFMKGYRKLLELSRQNVENFSDNYRRYFPKLLEAIRENAYADIIKYIRNISGNQNINMFLMGYSKTPTDKWDKYYDIENESFSSDFYTSETIDMLDKMLGSTSSHDVEVIGDTIYILKSDLNLALGHSSDANGNTENESSNGGQHSNTKSEYVDSTPPPDYLLSYVLRLSCADDELEDSSSTGNGKKIDLFFLIREKAESKICLPVISFFTAKLILALRSYLVKLVKNKGLFFRINELEAKKLKTALSIEKACQHIDREFFYGDKKLRELCSTKDASKLSGRYLQLIANELISEMYRKVVRNSITTTHRCYNHYGSNIEQYSFQPINKDGLYHYRLETYNKSASPESTILVDIRIDMKSLKNRTFIFYSKSASTIPEFYLLLILIGGNAAQHYEGIAKVMTVDVYGDKDGYLVFENKSDNAQIDMLRARERMNKAPMYFSEKEQSITLWTLNRYFQIAKLSDVYKDYPGLLNLDLQVESKGNRFILRLPVLADEC